MILPNVQDLRRAAGWRAGCSAVGMTAKAVRSGHWLGKFFKLIDFEWGLGIQLHSFFRTHRSSEETGRKAADQLPVFDVHPITEITEVDLDALLKLQISSSRWNSDNARGLSTSPNKVRHPDVLHIGAIHESDLHEKTTLVGFRSHEGIQERLYRQPSFLNCRHHFSVVASNGCDIVGGAIHFMPNVKDLPGGRRARLVRFGLRSLGEAGTHAA